MKILLETPEEERAMRVPEIHLAGLVEVIKNNELNERFEVLVLNKIVEDEPSGHLHSTDTAESASVSKNTRVKNPKHERR